MCGIYTYFCAVLRYSYPPYAPLNLFSWYLYWYLLYVVKQWLQRHSILSCMYHTVVWVPSYRVFLRHLVSKKCKGCGYNVIFFLLFLLFILMTLKTCTCKGTFYINLVSEWFIFNFRPFRYNRWWIHVYLLLWINQAHEFQGYKMKMAQHLITGLCSYFISLL